MPDKLKLKWTATLVCLKKAKIIMLIKSFQWYIGCQWLITEANFEKESRAFTEQIVENEKR